LPDSGKDLTVSDTDLTARLTSLREAVERQIQASSDMATIRMDGMDSACTQYLVSLAGERAALKEQIILVRELQDAYHESMQRQAELQHRENEITVTNLAAAMQLQLDQRFAAGREGAVLLQSELDRRFATLLREAAAMQLQINQRFASEEEARRTALVTATSAIQAALKAADTAVSKAEAATEERFRGVNEFRKTLSDQTASFPTREEVGVRFEALTSLITRNTEALKDLELRLTSRLDTAGGRDAGERGTIQEQRAEQGLQHSSVQLVIAGAAVFISAIAIIITIILHK
jgi:hypothetical protein